jgi:hypothetical protein
MKMITRMILTTMVTVSAAALTASAADVPGLAVSPKVQQMLNDRHAVAAAAARPVQADARKVCCEATGIAASPRVQQVLNERPKCCGPKGLDRAAVAPGLNAIAASPKLREQLADRY